MTLSINTMIADYFLELPLEIIVSLFVMLVVSILAVVFGRIVKKADVNKRPSVAVWMAVSLVRLIDNFVLSNLGKKFKSFSPYFVTIALYLFIAFSCGIFGLPSPMTYLGVPLCFALISFFMIHGIAIKYQKWGYFNRFVQPIFVLLPINIVSTISTIVSLSCRMFGNAIAGFVLLSLLYWVTGIASEALLGIFGLGTFNFIGPFIAPVFHAYFDIFGAFIQTLVFIFLTILFVAAEVPSEELA